MEIFGSLVVLEVIRGGRKLGAEQRVAGRVHGSVPMNHTRSGTMSLAASEHVMEW